MSCPLLGHFRQAFVREEDMQVAGLLLDLGTGHSVKLTVRYLPGRLLVCRRLVSTLVVKAPHVTSKPAPTFQLGPPTFFFFHVFACLHSYPTIVF